MSTIEKEALENMAEGFSREEQQIVLKHIGIDLLWNEIESRLREALDLKARLESVLKEGANE